MVTAENTTDSQEWTITVSVGDSPSSETDILLFAFIELTAEVEINSNSNTIDALVPFDSDISSLTTLFTLSEGATSNPNNGTTLDFSNPVTITVIAEDGETAQDWTVNVIIGPNPLSVEEQINLEVYPNPVMKILNVSTEIKVTVSLFDLHGRIKQPKTTGNNFKIDMSEYSDGIYLLILENDNQNYH